MERKSSVSEVSVAPPFECIQLAIPGIFFLWQYPRAAVDYPGGTFARGPRADYWSYHEEQGGGSW